MCTKSLIYNSVHPVVVEGILMMTYIEMTVMRYRGKITAIIIKVISGYGPHQDQ